MCRAQTEWRSEPMIGGRLCGDVQTARKLDSPAGALHDRSIDQLTAERDRAVAPRIRLVEGLQHALTVIDLVCCRAKYGIDGVDLSRMDERHAGKPEPP